MDLIAIANSVRRVSAIVEPRVGVDRLAVSLRVMLPIVEAAGATPELARELRTLVTRSSSVALVLPTGSGQARVDTGQRQFAVPAALRDAILVALEQVSQSSVRAQASSLAPPATPAGPSEANPASITKLIDASLQTAAARAGEVMKAAGFTGPTSPLRDKDWRLGLPGALMREPPAAPGRSAVAALTAPHATFDAPLLDAHADVATTGARLRTAVERSGLFFESHLAAWVRGERAAEAMNEEAQVVTRAETAAATGGLRAPAQLDVQKRDALCLQGPVWPGQSAAIEFRRETAFEDASSRAHAARDDASPVFSARLRLQLPRLGDLRVELHLVGATVAVTVESGERDLIERELPQLAAQLEAHGLQPIALRVLAVSPESVAP